MPHNCRTHCPPGRSPWRLDLLLTLLAIGGGAWLVGRAAPMADAAVSSVALAVVAAVVVVAVAAVLRFGVVAVLNRRARARWADIETAAEASRQAPALPSPPRALDASPTVRAEAFRVDEVERDVA